MSSRLTRHRLLFASAVISLLLALYAASRQQTRATAQLPPEPVLVGAPLVVAVASDREAYRVGDTVSFTVTITNPTDVPVTVTLRDVNPLYILAISDAMGTSVRSFSDRSIVGRQERTFTPGQTRVFTEQWDQRDRAGRQVPPNRYSATAVLMPCSSPDCPSAADRVAYVQGSTQFTIGRPGTPMPPAAEEVALVAGCTNVSLTWPDDTPVRTVALAASPSTALIGIWRLDAVAGHFRGWSPLPGAPNDLTTVRRLDAVFICMRAPGALLRPAI
jgi:uncharacterized repeat protein (TIGR01451 family)